MTMKSKETIVIRQISREVQRGFLADLGELDSVILRAPRSDASCRPIKSPGGTREEKVKQLTGISEISQNAALKC